MFGADTDKKLHWMFARLHRMRSVWIFLMNPMMACRKCGQGLVSGGFAILPMGEKLSIGLKRVCGNEAVFSCCHPEQM